MKPLCWDLMLLFYYVSLKRDQILQSELVPLQR